jgi:hypothetical protein
MNYLSELIFGKKTEEWEHTCEPDIIAKYCIHYCPYRYKNSCNHHPNLNSWGEEANQWRIEGINNNETDYSSTFPDFTEKIFDTEHYEQVICNLEKQYTNKAISDGNNIEITKRVKPYTFNYNDKDYDFSWYEFIITITKPL